MPVSANTPPRRLAPPSFWRAVVALMLREMATTYGRSPVGYLWAVAEPVAGILLMTFIFSLMFQQPPLGTSFPLFYASGMLPFLMYLDLSQKMGVAIRFSRPLLVYPTLGVLEALAARFLLNLMTQTVVVWLVLGAILWGFDLRVPLDALRVLEALGAMALLAAGVGTLNCYLIAASPSWERVWAILNRPMFLISGVFYTLESVPGGYADLLWFNPLVHGVGQMRAALYPSYDSGYVSLAYVCGIGLACLALGLLLVVRHHRTLLEG